MFLKISFWIVGAELQFPNTINLVNILAGMEEPLSLGKRKQDHKVISYLFYLLKFGF